MLIIKRDVSTVDPSTIETSLLPFAGSMEAKLINSDPKRLHSLILEKTPFNYNSLNEVIEHHGSNQLYEQMMLFENLQHGDSGFSLVRSVNFQLIIMTSIQGNT
jgi:hypothetical protein